MQPARIAERLEPFIGKPAVELLASISIYIDILLRWNDRINLTAIRDPEEIVTRHFGESLFAARHLFPRPAADLGTAAPGPLRVADLGSGAGFPGLPLKLWAPRIALTLIESNHRKSAFLREVIRALTLTDINVFPGRVEDFPHSSFDLVTLRAVERFESALAAAHNLLSPAGRLALLIGASQHHQACALLPEMQWQDPVPVPGSRSRILLLAIRPST